MKHFKSVKRLKEASREEVEKVVGKAKAAILGAHFHPETANSEPGQGK